MNLKHRTSLQHLTYQIKFTEYYLKSHNPG